MRTLKSLLKIFAVFPYIFSEVIIFDNENTGDDEIIEEMRQKGLNVMMADDSFDTIVPRLDVVYINAIAWVGDGFETYGSEFSLNKGTPFKKEAIVLHPLARGEELSTDLDNTAHNWYFSQARGAVFIRMALLTCLVHRKGRVLDVV